MAMAIPLVVPLDGSTSSRAALPYALTIARATAAEICLLAVVEDRSSGPAGRSAEAARSLMRAREQSLRQQLGATAGQLAGSGVRVTTALVTGDPPEEILAASAHFGGSLVVMATRGHGGVQRWLLGSVADKVMRLSSRPVLLIPPPEDGAASLTDAATLRRLMVPLDGSPLAEAALPVADSLGAAFGASLLFVRVEQWLVTMFPVDVGYIPNLAQMDEDAAAAAQSYLDEVRGRLTPTLESASIVARGALAETLIRVVEEEGIDLVVMSTQGRGGLHRLVLGSTADRVVRAGVPTLLVRS